MTLAIRKESELLLALLTKPNKMDQCPVQAGTCQVARQLYLHASATEKSFLLRLLAGCPVKLPVGISRKLHETSKPDCNYGYHKT